MTDVDEPQIQFLDNFREIFIFITLWTVTTVAVAYFLAGIRAALVFGCKCSLESPTWAYPILFCIFGAGAGFVHGAPMACVFAALYRSIPYEPGVDIATALGIGQGVLIVYFHLGGGVFIHYRECPEPEEDEVRNMYRDLADNRKLPISNAMTSLDPQSYYNSPTSKLEMEKSTMDRWNLKKRKRRFFRTARIKLFG
uniref:Uncharacterized protein n=1 Tax=Lotharella oceanica TaxID=641309 RepID=A0A7S2TNN6_9EUKA